MDKIKNIIFDFDGTLVDTAPLIISTMQAAIKALGLPEKSDSECRAMIGLRLEEIPSALWPQFPDVSELYAKTYRRLFEELKGRSEVRCFPGVIETLKQLRADGYRLAIASSRSHKSLAEYAESFGLTDLFSMLTGGDDVANGKPSPDPVLTICRTLGWAVGESLVVGDATFDIEMGHNAGARTCAVTYGNQSRSQLQTAAPDFIIDSFPVLRFVLCGVDSDVAEYVETEILPRYAAFDKAHREDHAQMVIEQSLKLARRFPELDCNMFFVIAAFHDLGLINGREHHHIDSGKILKSDNFISARFSSSQIDVMAEAIEDHRASKGTKPRSDYGLVVAEADRFIDVETIIRRTIQYGLANYPELDKDGHFQRTLRHLTEKYGPDGYLKIWIPESDNAERLRKLHRLIADEPELRKIFERIFTQETSRI